MSIETTSKWGPLVKGMSSKFSKVYRQKKNMPCPGKKKKGKKQRKHTPIVSEAQRGFFGAEMARKKAGKRGRTKMSKAELRRHLKESKGKKLVARKKKRKKGGRKAFGSYASLT